MDFFHYHKKDSHFFFNSTTGQVHLLSKDIGGNIYNFTIIDRIILNEFLIVPPQQLPTEVRSSKQT